MLAGKLPVSNNKLQQLKFKIINHKPPSKCMRTQINNRTANNTNYSSRHVKSTKPIKQSKPNASLRHVKLYFAQLYCTITSYIHTIHFSNYYNNLTPLAKPIHKYNTSMNSSKAMLYSCQNNNYPTNHHKPQNSHSCNIYLIPHHGNTCNTHYNTQYTNHTTQST
eukprot:gene3494-2445_t